MGFLKTLIGSIFYFGGIVVFLAGAYVLISTMLGVNDEIAFSGAIAGVGVVAIVAGVASFFAGRFVLK